GSAWLGPPDPKLHGGESNCTERAIFQKLVGTLGDWPKADRVRARRPKCDGSVHLCLEFADDADEKRTNECPSESAIPRTRCNKCDHGDKPPRECHYPWPGARANHID